jgi:hypothetical protein
MPWERYVLGYHGCDADLAREVVLGNQPLLPSANDYDWLGNGLYFWEDSAGRAIHWAEEECKKGHIKTPCVLGAIIDLGKCLNLIEFEYLDLLRGAYARLQETMADSGAPMPQNTGRDFKNRKLDCAVFESLHQFRESETLPSFDTVRAFFVEGEPLYATAGRASVGTRANLCPKSTEHRWLFPAKRRLS